MQRRRSQERSSVSNLVNSQTLQPSITSSADSNASPSSMTEESTYSIGSNSPGQNSVSNDFSQLQKEAEEDKPRVADDTLGNLEEPGEDSDESDFVADDCQPISKGKKESPIDYKNAALQAREDFAEEGDEYDDDDEYEDVDDEDEYEDVDDEDANEVPSRESDFSLPGPSEANSSNRASHRAPALHKMEDMIKPNHIDLSKVQENIAILQNTMTEKRQLGLWREVSDNQIKIMIHEMMLKAGNARSMVLLRRALDKFEDENFKEVDSSLERGTKWATYFESNNLLTEYSFRQVEESITSIYSEIDRILDEWNRLQDQWRE